MDPNQSKIANSKKPNTANSQNPNFSNFQNPNIQNLQNPSFPNFHIPHMVDPNFSQNPNYPHHKNFNYPCPYPLTQNPNPQIYQYPNPQFYQYPNNPFPQHPNNPQNQNVETKTKVSTNEHKLIVRAKKPSKSERDYVSESEAYTSSVDPDSEDPEDEEEDEEVLPEPVTQMPVVVKSKDKEKMKDDIPKSAEEVMKELEGFKTAHLMKSQALQEHARALELSARAKQRELDLQVLYKDTSSMSPQQLRVHQQMLDEISRTLESEN